MGRIYLPLVQNRKTTDAIKELEAKSSSSKTTTYSAFGEGKTKLETPFSMTMKKYGMDYSVEIPGDDSTNTQYFDKNGTEIGSIARTPERKSTDKGVIKTGNTSTFIKNGNQTEIDWNSNGKIDCIDTLF